MLKVIGAGFGRTGTMSLKVALEELGVGPCFHALDSGVAVQAGREPSQWARFAAGDGVDWREALDGWGSAVGWLGARFYEEMLAAWPQALLLLSVRDPDAWYASCHESIHATRRSGDLACRPAALGAGAGAGETIEAIDGTIWDGIFDGRFAEREHALELYHRHNEQVMRAVPEDRLLVYDVAEGWEPLCEFLGVEIPDVPFPHLNQAASFRARYGAPDVASLVGTRWGRVGRAPGARRTPRPRLCPRIGGVQLADSPGTVTQDEVLSLLGMKGDEFAERIFGRCGVQRRHLNLSREILATTVQGRTALLEEELFGYATEAVDALGVDPSEIGTVVTGTLYSLGGPTLAHRLVDHYGMDAATDKYHVLGVGCASAVPLMRFATQSLREHPGRKALVVGAESMTGLLMRAGAQDPRAKAIGSAIFGDGCAAAVLDGDPGAEGPAIVASKVHQIAGTLGAVKLELAAQDSYLHLDRDLPDKAGAGLAELADGFLCDAGLARGEIDHWIVHPGGRRIIESVQEALDLTTGQTAVSWEVLADHGNVGTPSIFYVLKKTIEQRAPRAGEHGLMITIGPGITVGLMLLRW